VFIISNIVRSGEDDEGLNPTLGDLGKCCGLISTIGRSGYHGRSGETLWIVESISLRSEGILRFLWVLWPLRGDLWDCCRPCISIIWISGGLL
jgi:hypothetical protein